MLARYDEFERALLDAIRAAPREAALLAVAERAMVAALEPFDAEEARGIEQLKRATPAQRRVGRGRGGRWPDPRVRPGAPRRVGRLAGGTSGARRHPRRRPRPASGRAPRPPVGAEIVAHRVGAVVIC